ncbi:hypothetical protein FACS1894156_1870 [Bacteroidia bacterium]|nr:hypothetical protein FACS1894156_1870 [Bacteroidia bacterium]
MTKKLFTFLLTVAMAAATHYAMAETTAAAPAVGNGTPGNPYQIANLANLRWLSETQSVWSGNNYFIQTADINAAETATDYDGTGTDNLGFKPIGKHTTNFTGIYNGKGHTISNLYINRTTTDSVGLFGVTNAAQLDSLGLVNVNIKGGGRGVGGLVGWNCCGSNIAHCYVTGAVSGKDYVGGLVGLNGAFVTNSYSTATVSATLGTGGGLVGYSLTFSASSYTATIAQSYATGAVSGREALGGLVGSNIQATITNCYATGAVSSTGDYTGGLVGHNRNATIINSYATGAVSASGSYIGGLVGWKRESATITNCYYNSQTSGRSDADRGTPKTTAEMKQQSTYENWDFTTIWNIFEGSDSPYLLPVPPPGIPAGNGTAGNPYQIANLANLRWLSETQSVWSGNNHFIQTANIDAAETRTWNQVPAITSPDYPAHYEGFKPIGNDPGDAGTAFSGTYNGKGHIISNLHIERVASGVHPVGLFGYILTVGNDTARVDSLGLTDVNISSREYIGALAGKNVGGKITNVYSTGKIKLSLGGTANLGGLVGENDGGTIANSYSMCTVLSGDGMNNLGGLAGSNNSVIYNTYAAGKIITTGTNNTGDVGGLVGQAGFGVVAVTNSFFDTQITGQTNSNGGTGKTTADMQKQTTYPNAWFANAWKIRPDSSYAYLAWQSAPVRVNSCNTNSVSVHLLRRADSVVVYNTNRVRIGYLGAQSTGGTRSIDFFAPVNSGDTLDVVTYGYSTQLAPSYPVPTIAVFSFSGGDGSAGNPFVIHDFDDLQILSEDTTYWGINPATGKPYYFIQDADIDAAATQNSAYGEGNGAGFKPIGTNNSTPFQGTYNGKGHTISNLYIKRTDNTANGLGYYIGLFGYLYAAAATDTARVDSVGLVNVNIKGYLYVGGLAGYSRESKITNSYVTGAVSSENNFVGGLVGYNFGATTTNSYSTAAVSGTNNVGGLIGINRATFEDIPSPISNCYSTGAVSGTNSVGGLAGNNSDSPITNSYSTATVSGTNQVGGLVGGHNMNATANYNVTSITNSYSTGAVSGTGTYVGGFVGYNNTTNISQNYYDKTTGGKDNAFGTSVSAANQTGVTSLPTDSMWMQTTYTAWTFGGKPWTIRPDSSYAYFPYQSAPVYVTERSSNSLNINLLRAADSVVIYNKTQNSSTKLPAAQLTSGGSKSVTPVPALGDTLYITTYQAGKASSYPVQAIGQVPAGATPPFSGGDGSAGNPFVIRTLDDLKYLSEHPEYWGESFVQTADIDATATRYWNSNGSGGYYGFSPIGMISLPFTGTYNGKGHNIRHLYMNRPTRDTLGIFGHLRPMGSGAGRIDSLGVVDANITGDGSHFGGLVGNNAHGTVSNCYLTGVVSAARLKNNTIGTGGLVGSNWGSVSNSYFIGTVNNGAASVGGLVGDNNIGTVSNSYSMGTVSGISNVGGLVGNIGTVSNSYSVATVYGTNNVGGLAGNNPPPAIILSNSYYDSIAGNQKDTGKGEPKTTAEMWSTTTAYTAWTFGGNPWTIRPDSSYAYFPWQSAPIYIIERTANILNINLLQAADSVVIYNKTQNSSTKLPAAQLTSGGSKSVTPVPALGDTLYITTYEAGKASSYPVQAIGQVTAGATTPPFSGGDGSENNPFVIKTFADLQFLSEHPDYWVAPNNHFIQTADIDAGITQTGGSGYTANGEGFSPIGNNYNTPFQGTYNGKGHVISNLYINRPNTSNVGIGLFGTLELQGTTDSAWVDSLGVVNVDIRGSSNVGGLVGRLGYKSKVINSYSTGKVSGTSYVGGLVGPAMGGRISNSYSMAAVSGTEYVGGLLGEITYSNSTVSNSYAMGTVSGTNHHIGGFLGALASGRLFNTYYDSITSGRKWAVGGNNSTNGTNPSNANPKTTAEMWNTTTAYTSWNFTTTWTIRPDSSYAYFPWQSAPIYMIERTANVLNINLLQAADSVVIYNKTQNSSTKLSAASAGSKSVTPVPALSDTLYITTYEAGKAPSYPVQAMGVGTVVPPTPPFSGGDGSENNPFVIKTLDDLQLLSENPQYWGEHFVQDADIDAGATGNWNNGAGFEPIGNDSTPFTGTYDGQGHTLGDLYINRPAEDNIGLFGVADSAQIDDLILKNVDITGRDNVGGLVGSSNININDVAVSGKVEGHDNVGGIIGNQQDDGTLSNSSSTAAVSGNDNVGGLVGVNDGGTVSQNYASGATSGHDNVGGIIGHNNGGTVADNYALGAVSGNNNVGGAVGNNSNNGSLTNAYATGTVSAAGTNAGGLVGNNTAAVSGGYYNSQTTGQSDSGKGTPKTTAEMLQENTFAGWDFATPIWAIHEGKTYPYFGWQSAPAHVNGCSPDTLNLNLNNTVDSIVIYDNNDNVIAVIPGPISPGDSIKIPIDNIVSGDTIYVVVHENGKKPSSPVEVVVEAEAEAGSNETSSWVNDIPDAEFVKDSIGGDRWVLNCSRTDSVVIITIGLTDPAAKIIYQGQQQPGRSFEVNVSRADIYTVTYIVVAADNTASDTVTFLLERQFVFSDIARQRWNNTLVVNNNFDNNNGYHFVAYQWYKDEQKLGTGQYYSAGEKITKLLDSAAQYRVEMTTAEGKILHTCPAIVKIEPAASLRVYPNPTSHQITVTTDPLDTATPIEIYNAKGILVGTRHAVSPQIIINIEHLPTGVYIIKIGNTTTKVVKK